MLKKNHAIGTRRVSDGHYQIVITNVQSGKCLKVLADAVRDHDMTATDFEAYIEGMFQFFVNPKNFDEVVFRTECPPTLPRPHACSHCDERCNCGRDESDCDWCDVCAPSAETAGIQVGAWNAEVGR